MGISVKRLCAPAFQPVWIQQGLKYKSLNVGLDRTEALQQDFLENVPHNSPCMVEAM